MARLTDNLATNYRGKETQRAVDPGPSIWEGLAKVVSQGVGIASDVKKTSDRIKQETASNAAAAKKASDTGALNAFAQGAFDISTGNDQPTDIKGAPVSSADASVAQAQANVQQDPVNWQNPGEGNFSPQSAFEGDGTEGDGLALANPEAAAAGNDGAQTAKRFQSAVEQGRMTETSYNLKMQSLITNLFAKFPDSKAVVWEQFDKFAIDHPLLAPYKRAKLGMDAVAADDIKNEQADARYYQENIVVGQDDPNAPFEKQVEEGRRKRSLENDWDRIQKRSAATRAEAGENRTVTDRDRKDATSSYVTAWQTYMSPQFQETTQQLTKLTLDPSISDPDKFTALTNAVNAYRTGAYQAIQQMHDDILVRSKGNVDPELLSHQRDALRKQVDDVLTLFDPSNPLNVIKRNATQAQMITDATGLKMAQAAPILMELKRQFPNDDSLNMMIQTAMADPKITKLLAFEMQNINGLGDSNSKVHLMNTINMIKNKNTDLRDLPPAQGANALNNLTVYLSKSLPEAARTNSPGLVEDSLTALGKVANVAVDLKVGTPFVTTVRALSVMANGNTSTVLMNAAKDPSNKEYAGIVGDGLRAAVTQQIINVSKTKTDDGLFDVVFNKSSGAFEARRNAAPGPNYQGYDSMANRGKPTVVAPTDETNRKIESLNRGLNFMVTTGQFEDEMPISKWTNPEQRLFYATGGTPPGQLQSKDKKVEGTMSLISKVANKWNNYRVDWSKIDPVTVRDASTARGLGAGSNDERTVTGVKGNSISVPATASIIEQNKDNPVFQSVRAAANAEGIPESILIRLGHVEGGFKVQNGHNSSNATGPLQVVGHKKDGTPVNDPLAVKMFGKPVAELSTDQKIAVGARLLKLNYDKYGSWNMAVQRYLGKGNDGNLDTKDYAYLIGAD